MTFRTDAVRPARYPGSYGHHRLRLCPSSENAYLLRVLGGAQLEVADVVALRGVLAHTQNAALECELWPVSSLH